VPWSGERIVKKILVIGGGGREHALAWKLAGDSERPRVFCAPGNAGTAGIATNLPIAAEDISALAAWARAERPDLTVVGPEAPLCAGLSDMFSEAGLPVFGPSGAGARLEGSKVFSKDVMEKAGVPTAGARSFTDADAAVKHARSRKPPLVVKADGLAAGKGVIICGTAAEAETAILRIMKNRCFGEAGRSVLVEDFLEGEEASILALTDGEEIVPLASSQDHKRVSDGDKGPNTGGMGAYSPAPVVTDDLWPVIRSRVLAPTLAELAKRGIRYRGVIYAGLMIGRRGPMVLEFNCRFGDPETQAVIPRIDGDLFPALMACACGGLRADMLRWRPDPCVCVVMASGGYPDAYQKGGVISGLDSAGGIGGVTVFHAGTAVADGKVVTAGGRVLGVTATAPGLKEAIGRAYEAVGLIKFEGAQFRTDIGRRALARTQGVKG